MVSDTWMKAYNGVLDSYLGEVPTSFTYNGKDYTPQSFAQEMGLKADDYVSITSFTHHPYNEQFILEVPDNFSNGLFYNVTLDDMMATLDHALENGIHDCLGHRCQ